MTGNLTINMSTDANPLTLRAGGTSTSVKSMVLQDNNGIEWGYFRKRTLSDANTGFELTFNTSGTSGTVRGGFIITLNAGYTGNEFTSCLAFDNAVAGTGVYYLADATTYGYRTGGANRGIGGYARGVTIGHNVGGLFLAGGGSINYGSWSSASITKANGINVGAFLNGINGSGTSPSYIGAYITNYNVSAAPPNMTGVKTALLVDNQTYSSDIALFRDNGTIVFNVCDYGLIVSQQVANTSGVLNFWSVTSAANTGRTASTEVVNLLFNLSAEQTWATGALTTQREVRFRYPSYSFVGASTITTAATISIEGAPLAGSNATITNSYALWIEGGASRFDGRIMGTSVSVTAANDLTLGAANQFLVSGNTQINAITTAGWRAGSKITLIFSGTPTVKHNTAGGAGTAVLFLAGSVDLVASANTVLGLQYDGTQWQETFRKVA